MNTDTPITVETTLHVGDRFPHADNDVVYIITSVTPTSVLYRPAELRWETSEWFHSRGHVLLEDSSPAVSGTSQ